MAGSFWTPNIPAHRAPVTKGRPKALSAPSTPADRLTMEALNQAEQRIAAFSLQDRTLAEMIQREQPLLQRPDGGTLYRQDLPSFDPNAPRGGIPQVGATKSRLEEYDANLARGGGAAGGGGIGIPAVEAGLLSIRSDPQVLIERIVELETELQQAQHAAAHYQAENAHLAEMLALAQASGGVGMGQGVVDPLMQMRIEQAVQARLLAQSQGHGMNWRSGASNGSFGSSGGLSQGHGISPLQRVHGGFRYSPNNQGQQPGIFGGNNMFNQ